MIVTGGGVIVVVAVVAAGEEIVLGKGGQNRNTIRAYDRDC